MLMLLSVLTGCSPLVLEADPSDVLEDTGAATLTSTDDSGDPDGSSDSGGPGDTGDTGSTDDADDALTAHPTTPPALPTYSEGACPALRGGATLEETENTGFLSSGNERSFRLLVPESYDGSTPMPLVFAWHWLNASSDSFISQGEMESAVEQMDFIAVFPDDIEDAYLFNWPFFEVDDAEQELVFFEDLLACVSEQYTIDPAQVHGIGVSAGGLWLTYLSTTERVQHFASIMTLSGGLGEAYGFWEMDWQPQERKFPALVLNGGDSDWFGIDFHAASERYAAALLEDGHFVVTCEHTEGHAMPPMEPPVKGQTTFYALWQFMLDHPYSLDAGESPYEDGLPDFFPEWCGLAE